MKQLIAIALFAAAFSVQADDFARLSESLCEYVKNDDRTSIRKKLKTVNLELRNTYTGFVCQPEGNFNGGSLLKTAAYYGSAEVSSFIIRKISKEDLAYTEHDGVTTSDWIKEASNSGNVKDVNKTKSIAAEVEERLGE
ncbi:DUF3718 domain-containing protein [Pleionea litopenaei]|uniref:DUF3718 domain-containing protein n=1 Tax=Pleionea litopenaei TaxID=3070815 RepID=A0AA51RV17_9GAMM|nr:DUF3718 domain-containing protein [Pleionea sp. HL-JVS1]WMS88004.1 DUF3718 domain-containing protein [Pleionea sp. HL-JVS1]